MSWNPCEAEDCENQAVEDSELCDAHLALKLANAKLDTAIAALTDLSYEHETSLYRNEMYKIAKDTLAQIQSGLDSAEQKK